MLAVALVGVRGGEACARQQPVTPMIDNLLEIEEKELTALSTAKIAAGFTTAALARAARVAAVDWATASLGICEGDAGD